MTHPPKLAIPGLILTASLIFLNATSANASAVAAPSEPISMTAPMGADSVFADVPVASKEWMQPWVEMFYGQGITGGCGIDTSAKPLYCPEQHVTRAALAVFLLRGLHYPNLPYTPDAQSGTFADVPTSGKEWMTPWIEEYYDRGISGGCQTSPMSFCPEQAVMRDQMAVFLLRAKYGAAYNPPAAAGLFADVPVAGREWMTPWVEQLYRENITGGCGTNSSGQLLFCPNQPVTRASMAVFIMRTLPNLPEPATPATPLSAPNIAAPTSGAQIAHSAQPFIFNWDAVSGSIGYHLQISTNSGFTSLAYDVMPTSDGWAAQAPLNAGTYYWRVRARTSTSNGSWSEVRSVVILAPVAVPTPIAPHLSPMAYRTPYAAASPWNTPIGANPQVDRYSSQMISLWGTNATGGRITSDTTQYTYPVYFADRSTPRHTIPCVKYKCSIVDDAGNITRVTSMTNVPIPNGAKQSAGTDAQMIIIDSETGEEWGFYQMSQQADGSWQAGNGYRYHMNYTGSTPGFGSRGAGVPYYAGLIRAHEIRNGEINHAIAFVYQFTSVKGCVYPATMTDGQSTNAYAIPEGARIQLNPNLTDADFDRMGLTRAGKIVARAMQKYGLILIDSGGSSKIIAENLTANTLYGENWSDPDLQYTKNVVYNIPVTEFRVLALPDGYHNAATANWGKCNK